MPLTAIHLLLVLGVILALVGLIGLHAGTGLSLALPSGIGLLAASFLSDWRRSKRVKKERQEAVESRINELTSTPWGSHQSMSIKDSVWISIILLLTVLTSAFTIYTGVNASPVHWPMTLYGAFFLAIAIIPALRNVPNLLKPALELSIFGFATPIHGSIAWSEVSGIHLDKQIHRGVTTFWLWIQVGNLQQVVTGMHWSERLGALLRGAATGSRTIRIRLLASHELPEVVYAVAHHLWKQATGNDHAWYPAMSASFNEAEKRNSEILAKIKDPIYLEQSFEHQGEILQNIEQLKANMKLMHDEIRRRRSRGILLIVVLVIPLILFVTWRLFKLF